MSEKNAPTIKKKSKKPLRTAGGHFASKFPHLDNLPSNIRTRLILIGEMKRHGFKAQQVQNLLMELYREVTELNVNGTVTGRFPSTDALANAPRTKNDSTQLVPVSNIQASSMSPNFDTIRSFFLTGRQKHPKMLDWISAEEMGELVGMKADNVKKYSTEYARARGVDISNNIAEKIVIDNGGYFKGISKLVDEHVIPCYVNHDIGCAGIWYLMEDGKIVWRNYWSPAAVKTILDSIPAEKKTLPQKSLNPFSGPPPGPPDAPRPPPGNKVG